MELTATEFDVADNGEFLTFGFYDNERLYGFGFSRVHGENRIEMMIADQSVYDLEQADIRFSKDLFEISLPSGTIDSLDGDDHYKISYKEMSQEVFERSLRYLQRIISGHSKYASPIPSTALASLDIAPATQRATTAIGRKLTHRSPAWRAPTGENPTGRFWP